MARKKAGTTPEPSVKSIGRPRFTIEDLSERFPQWDLMMREIAQEGGSEVSVRVKLGIGTTAFETLIADSEVFRETIKECRDLCRHWWEETGRDLARGKIEGNAAVYIFNMKNRFGWRDKIELSGDPDAPFQVESKKATLTDEQLLQQAKERGFPLAIFEKVVSEQ